MATKSIIDIEVDDSQFKAFYDLYQQFQSKVEILPDSFKLISGIGDKSRDSFKNMSTESSKVTEKTAQIAKEIVRAIKAQKDFNDAARTGSRTMEHMAKSSAALGKNIFGIGKYLLKIGAIGIAGSIGGMFGMGALGNSAVGGQRQARGLGINQGQIRAFSTDFSRFVSPSILGSMAGAQSDFKKRVYLALAAGVGYQQAGTEGVDKLAIKSAMRAHEWWKNTAPGMRTEQTLGAAGFGHVGYTMEDMRRLGNTPMSELKKGQAQYSRDAGSLGVSDKNTAAWYNLTRQLNYAGQKIETVLINKLSALAPTLGNLTSTITKDISALVNSITPKDIEKFADGIKGFAEYIGSGAVISNLKEFMGVITGFLKATGHAVHTVMPLSAPERKKQMAKIERKNARTIANDKSWFMGAIGLGNHNHGGETKRSTTPLTSKDIMDRKERYLGRLEGSFGLPKGLLDSIWLQESSRGKNMLSSAGAIGDFGYMPNTAKSLKINPYDFSQSGFGTAKIIHENMIHYHGSLRKALAAYNWGSGNLGKDIKKNGADWGNHLPGETSNYINKVTGRLGGQSVNITITNKTGSDISTSVNAVAH